MFKKPLLSLLTLLLISASFIAWTGEEEARTKSHKNDEDKWVDSVFHSMSHRERLGQLFMIAAYSNKNETHYSNVQNLIEKYNIGGIIFFQGGPVRQAVLTNRYQKAAKVPLLIAMDAEWGLGMRLDSTISFPKQMTLGAIQDDQLIYKMGQEIGEHCNRLGVHVNFAPVVDINVNMNNPVIGTRSFGEDRDNVARKGVAYMKGLQSKHVMANAKHFPGHGDTDTDSHLDLPVINHNVARLDSIELYPFKKLIEDSLASVMVAHLHVPALDAEKNTATTLSHHVVTDLLKEKLGFTGLIFTDAINMKGVSKFYEPAEINVRALMAGNDVLLFPVDVPAAMDAIEAAFKDGKLERKDIEARVKKVLHAKYRSGLSKLKPIETKNLYKDLNSAKSKALVERLYTNAITVVKNDKKLLPLRYLDTLSLATIAIGEETTNEFQRMVSRYTKATHYHVSRSREDADEYNSLLSKVKKYEVVIVSIHNMTNSNRRDYRIHENARKFIADLSKHTRVILSVFGNPYSMKFFGNVENVICGYRDLEITQKLVPQVIFGGLKANGRLPVSSSDEMRSGKGVDLGYIDRFHYTAPENVCMASDTLKLIDDIVHQAMADSATPGCQVVVARKGNVVFNKAYGKFTYEGDQEVKENSIYDIASITKIASTTLAVMFLYDRGEIDLDQKLSKYLPSLKGTNKEDMVIRDILTHQAGLQPYIMHWMKTVDDNGLNTMYYCEETEDGYYCNTIVPGLYSVNYMEDSLWKWTVDSELLRKPRRKDRYDYRYSDLGFYMMKRLVEKLTNQPIEDFVAQNIYNPLGATTLGYLPLENFDEVVIVPTEKDEYFRNTLVRGTVHDQGAAMIGGVGGHAGVFGSAHDLSKVMQMLSNYGYYGGRTYFNPQTIVEFTTTQFEENRRGLGFDKPEPTGNGPTSDFCSGKTFGHSGFTGTGAWVDPEYELVYVFLSNRVYPDAANRKLVTSNVRTNIHDVIYRSMTDVNIRE